MVAVSLWPFALGTARESPYAVAAVVLSLGYLWYTIRFARIGFREGAPSRFWPSTGHASHSRPARDLLHASIILSAAAACRHDARRPRPLALLILRNYRERTPCQPRLQTYHLRTPPGVIAGIIAVSAAASALICWLVYFHAPTDVAHTHLRSLPLVNAVLNALATIALVTGYHEIRQRRILHHRASMFGAFFFSSIFLVSYLVNFTLHGETRFNRFNPWWPFYWKLLAARTSCCRRSPCR
jgi:hypothetical protein